MIFYYSGIFKAVLYRLLETLVKTSRKHCIKLRRNNCSYHFVFLMNSVHSVSLTLVPWLFDFRTRFKRKGTAFTWLISKCNFHGFRKTGSLTEEMGHVKHVCSLMPVPVRLGLSHTTRKNAVNHCGFVTLSFSIEPDVMPSFILIVFLLLPNQTLCCRYIK